MDAVTGRLSGLGEKCVYQCHIRASAGRERVTSASLGNNDQSWSLICTPDSYSFRHNNICDPGPQNQS